MCRFLQIQWGETYWQEEIAEIQRCGWPVGRWIDAWQAYVENESTVYPISGQSRHSFIQAVRLRAAA